MLHRCCRCSVCRGCAVAFWLSVVYILLMRSFPQRTSTHLFFPSHPTRLFCFLGGTLRLLSRVYFFGTDVHRAQGHRRGSGRSQNAPEEPPLPAGSRGSVYVLQNATPLTVRKKMLFSARTRAAWVYVVGVAQGSTQYFSSLLRHAKSSPLIYPTQKRTFEEYCS